MLVQVSILGSFETETSQNLVSVSVSTLRQNAKVSVSHITSSNFNLFNPVFQPESCLGTGSILVIFVVSFWSHNGHGNLNYIKRQA